MPDKYLSAEKRGRLYSVYLRPWVLDARWATPGVVPYITDLNVVPTTAVGAPAVKRRRLRGKRPPAAAVQATRSFELAWRWYIDGHIVSRHAVRLIVQFMAANCGKSRNRDTQDEDVHQSKQQCPASTMALQRIHAIIDELGNASTSKTGAVVPDLAEPSDDEEEE